MAKKKSKKNNIKPILKLVALVLGVGAVLFGLLKSITFIDKVLETETSFTGFQVIFGYTEEIKAGNTVLSTVEHLTFSFMALLAFLLPLLGGVLTMPKNKILNFVAMGCFVAGAILLFLLPSFAITELYVAKLFTSKLAVGAILAAICSILGGLVSAYITLTK